MFTTKIFNWEEDGLVDDGFVKSIIMEFSRGIDKEIAKILS
jgi:hypothetical protein